VPLEIEALIEEAAEALRRSDWAAAESSYRSVLEAGDSGEAEFGLGIARWWQGETVEALRSWERAYASFCRVSDPGQAAFTGVYLCLAYRMSLGNDAAANGWLERAAALVDEWNLDPLQGWVLLCRAYSANDNGEPRAAEAFAQQAIEIARGGDDADLVLCATSELGAALVGMGDLERGAALLDQAMAAALAGEAGDLDSVVLISCRTITSCARVADIKRAVQWIRAADDFNERYGSTHLFTTCRTHHGSVLFAVGEWAKAEDELQAALTVGVRAEPVLRAEAASKLAEMRVAQGRVDESERLLESCRDVPAAAHARALVHLAKGDAGAAISLVQRRLRDLDEACVERAALLDTLAEAALATASHDTWPSELDGVPDRAATGVGGLEGALLARASGRMSSARDNASAVRDLRQAVSSFASLEMPFECARTRLALGRVLAVGQPEEAIAEASDALAAFDRLGAPPGADAAAELLRSLGKRSPRIGPKGLAVLTKREREVLALLGEGLSNPAIAERLFISRKTVENHVANVLSKLGLQGRAEAAVYAARSRDTDSSPQ
jgi:DNA-binding NarL/FixJ family response regulator